MKKREIDNNKPETEEQKNKILKKLKEDGNNEYKKKNYKKALEYYTKYLKIEENSIVYCNRATCHYQLGELDKSIKDNTKSIELDNFYVKAYFRRGTIRYQQGLYTLALEDYKMCLLIDQNKNPIFLKKVMKIEEHLMMEKIQWEEYGEEEEGEFFEEINKIEEDEKVDDESILLQNETENDEKVNRYNKFKKKETPNIQVFKLNYHIKLEILSYIIINISEDSKWYINYTKKTEKQKKELKKKLMLKNWFGYFKDMVHIERKIFPIFVNFKLETFKNDIGKFFLSIIPVNIINYISGYDMKLSDSFYKNSVKLREIQKDFIIDEIKQLKLIRNKSNIRRLKFYQYSFRGNKKGIKLYDFIVFINDFSGLKSLSLSNQETIFDKKVLISKVIKERIVLPELKRLEFYNFNNFSALSQVFFDLNITNESKLTHLEMEHIAFKSDFFTLLKSKYFSQLKKLLIFDGGVTKFCYRPEMYKIIFQLKNLEVIKLIKIFFINLNFLKKANFDKIEIPPYSKLKKIKIENAFGIGFNPISPKIIHTLSNQLIYYSYKARMSYREMCDGDRFEDKDIKDFSFEHIENINQNQFTIRGIDIFKYEKFYEFFLEKLQVGSIQLIFESLGSDYVSIYSHNHSHFFQILFKYQLLNIIYLHINSKGSTNIIFPHDFFRNVFQLTNVKEVQFICSQKQKFSDPNDANDKFIIKKFPKSLELIEIIVFFDDHHKDIVFDYQLINEIVLKRKNSKFRFNYFHMVKQRSFSTCEDKFSIGYITMDRRKLKMRRGEEIKNINLLRINTSYELVNLIFNQKYLLSSMNIINRFILKNVIYHDQVHKIIKKYFPNVKFLTIKNSSFIDGSYINLFHDFKKLESINIEGSGVAANYYFTKLSKQKICKKINYINISNLNKGDKIIIPDIFFQIISDQLTLNTFIANGMNVPEFFKINAKKKNKKIEIYM